MPQPPATRRRRDGQPVQQRTATRRAQTARTPSSERAIAVQRAPAAAPAERADGAIPAVAAAATTAAALAALAALKPSPAGPTVTLAVTAAAVARAATAILDVFDRVHADRRAALEGRVLGRLALELPAAEPAALRALVSTEVEREKTFQAKARARLERDLPAALAIQDEEKRRIAVRKILEREKRYAELREDAITARAGGQVELERLKAILVPQGVTGMFWRLNDRLEHCARCLALAGRIWPWTLLELYHPPMHLNCGCRLWTPEDAFRLGWATPASIATVDAAISMMHLLESAHDFALDPEGLWIVEAGA